MKIDRVQQFVLVMAGTTGSGKTTIANLLTQQLPHVRHLETDLIRKELAGLPPLARVGTSSLVDGIYCSEMTDATYNETCFQAQQLLSNGWSVILDGTFRQRIARKKAWKIARSAKVRLMIAECFLDRSLQLCRLEDRYAKGNAVSEGRPELLSFHENDWEPLLANEADAIVRLDASLPIDQLAWAFEQQGPIKLLVSRVRR
jgi:uncharacterized protein